MEIDTSTWKEFRIGDLFEICRGDRSDRDEHYFSFQDEEYKYPVVTTTTDNNGIDGYYNKKNCDGNCIVSGGEANGMFTTYQANPFWGLDTVRIYIPKGFQMNENLGMFFSTVLTQNMYRFSYGRKAKPSNICTLVIKLPSTPSGEPDWQFMEDYIKSLHHKPLTTQNKVGQAPDLNVRDWKAFNIQRTSEQAGLFVIENCKCGSAGELEDGSDINYIGAKKSDNGVMRSVVNDEKLVSKGHGIMFICDGEGSVGYTNYMDKDFIGSTTTSIGYDEALTETNAMFLVTVLDNEKFKYSYGRKYRTHMIEAQIYLPIQHNVDGTPCIDNTHKYSDDGYVPDWQYMEDYIKSLPYGDKLGVLVERNVHQRKCKKNE